MNDSSYYSSVDQLVLAIEGDDIGYQGYSLSGGAQSVRNKIAPRTD